VISKRLAAFLSINFSLKVIKSLPSPSGRTIYGYAKAASDPEGCVASPRWYSLCWFVRLVDQTDRSPSVNRSDSWGASSRRSAGRSIRALLRWLAERVATLDPRAERALRRVRFFPEGLSRLGAQTSRGKLGDASITAGPPRGDDREEVPHRAERFRNGGVDRPTPRLSVAEIGCRPARVAEQAALREALELVGGIHAASARLRQADFRTAAQSFRDVERARRSAARSRRDDADSGLRSGLGALA